MLRFDRAVVDVPGRTVELDGLPQHLEPQAFDLLAYLVAHRDRYVTKAELLDAVWGDQFVSESALTTRIKEVRRAVGDDGARQAVVRNQRGRGYRFVAELDDVGPAGLDTTLHGRGEDVSGVVGLVERVPLVTVVGPGGVGKTSLARDVAVQVADRFDAGVLTVSLARIDESPEVVHVLRRDVGLDDAGRDESDLLAAVADLDALLIIDNCEHVIDEVARLVRAIVERAGRVHVLATSRERLGLLPEHVWPLRPLDPSASRSLLLERVRALEPGWEDDDEEAIGLLLDLVDHLPLAIEMAAARIPSVGLRELVDLLDVRLDLLRSTERGVEERHQTLPALIEWSEQLLDPDARRLLADLSVFAGSVAAHDIAAVVGSSAAELVAGPLADLVERSLVVADIGEQPTRYRLLATVRACVAPRRPSGLDEAHARHVAAVLAEEAVRLRTPEEPEAAARIDGLTAEIRAAHRWSREHDLALAARITASLLHHAHERQWSEPASWCRSTVERLDGDVPAPFAAMLAADASNRGEYERAVELAEVAAADPDPLVAASALDTLVNVGLYTGDLDAAERHSAAILVLAAETGDAATWASGQAGTVLALVYAGRVSDAKAQHERSRPPGPLSPTCAAWFAYGEGEILAAEGSHDAAVAAFERTVELVAPVGSTFVASVARTSALAARSRSDDVEGALAAFGPVLLDYRRTRSLTHAATALRNLVGLLVRAGRHAAATEIIAALSTPGVKSTYGMESEMIDAALATIEADHPAELVDGWRRTGTGRDLWWALDRAIEAIDPGLP